MKIKELRKKTKGELVKELVKFKKGNQEMRFNNTKETVKDIKSNKKTIARIMTILNE